MKKKVFAAVVMGILASSLVAVAPASAGSFCNNGTYSANSGRGTCSWNGGVNRSLPSFSDPGSSSFNRNNGFGSSRNNGFGSSSNFGSSRNNSFGSSRCSARFC